MARGPQPQDRELFAERWLPRLRAAASDLSFLLERGYGANGALTLVGDRYQLEARQRVAVARCACSDSSARGRASKHVALTQVRSVHIDGLNVLTTVDVALAGGVVLKARDGCLRDLASYHGTYRLGERLEEAALLVGKTLAGREACWLLDRPVSNTGRLAAALRALAEDKSWPWTVELVGDPDAVLKASSNVVASSDSAILDGTNHWTNLTAAVVEALENPWLVELG